MSAGIYPKASAPVTPEVLDAANARADRWRKRYEDKVAEVAALEAELDRQILLGTREDEQ